MKNIVILDDYHLRDLKPPELLRTYLELTERDVRSMLVPVATVEIPCPACGSEAVEGSFEKFGLAYRECGTCGSLYVSPRPDETALAAYDADSEARSFWREQLAPGSGAARREKIVKPRSQWVEDTFREYRPAAKRLIDVGTAQAVYVTELLSSGLFERIMLVDPVVDASETDEAVLRADWAGVAASPGCAGAATLLEVTDRTADPGALFARVRDALCDGGLAFVTAILASGFDLQVLREHAENVFPPDRLNVMTVDGLTALAERSGFEVLEFSTPGILDVEIVASVLERDETAPAPRWVRYLLSRPEHTRRAFQQFLQSEQMSSYGRAVLRKP